MEMKADNAMEVIFDAKSENESFARVTAAAFCTRLDPTVEEIADIKTAVSEAVTNSIVHGYEGIEGKITLKVSLVGQEVRIEVHDDGIGIEKCRAGNGAALYNQTGAGTFRNGIFLYGSFYG